METHKQYAKIRIAIARTSLALCRANTAELLSHCQAETF